MGMHGIYANGKRLAAFVVPLTLRTNQPETVSDSLSLKRSTKRRAAQRWELEARLDPLHLDANELFVQMIYNGHTVPFNIIIPQNVGVDLKRTATGIPLTSGNAGATQLNMTGFNGLIPAGSFIRFSNHSKVYLTMSDRLGPGTVNIYPALRVSLQSHTTQYDDVPLLVRYDTDTIIGMQYSDGILMDNGVIKMVEAV